jgi:hypothetical protein
VVDQCFHEAVFTGIDRLTIVQSLNAAHELVVQEDASWCDKHPSTLRVCRRKALFLCAHTLRDRPSA